MVVAVTALAFLPRAVQVLIMSDPAVNPHWLRPVMDAAVHDLQARDLLAGDWPPGAPFFAAPLYPFVLGSLYSVFGADDTLAALLVHALISALGAGLVALIARRLWSPRAGWMAGVIHAVLWPSIFFAAEMLAVTVTVTLLLLAVWLLLRAPMGARLAFLWAGVALGAACLARPNLLVLVPLWAWFVLRHRSVGWRSPGWALLVAGVVVAILPVTIHNARHGAVTSPIATSGGVNLYIGNNPRADGASVVLPDVPPSRLDMPENLTRVAERETGRLLDESAVDRHFAGKALAFWADDPGAALRLQVEKLRLLVAMHERSNTMHLYFWRDRSSLLRWPVWLGFTPVLLLAVLGFWRRDIDPGARWLLLASAVAFALTLTVFFVNGRFRLPLLALLVVPAAGGLDWLWAAWRTKRWDVPRPAWIAVAVAAVVSVGPDLVSFDPRDGFGNPFIWYSLGQSYQAIEDDDRAIDAYRQAVARRQAATPSDFARIEEPLYISLGDLLTRNGRSNEALRVYAGWARANPRSLEARVRTGELLLQTGEIQDAAGQFQAVLKAEPDHAGARLGMAWVRLYAGRTAEAHAEFEAIHRAEPNAHALFGAGLALLQLDRLEKAERTFREVLVVDPTYWQAWGNLGDLYDRQGETRMAAEAYEKLLEINPADQGARQWLRAHRERR